ncbi:hypothetical protein [Pseudomonas sp. 2FE]|nr:hypothetical protein [Pseudomonas sp. 2FE]
MTNKDNRGTAGVTVITGEMSLQRSPAWELSNRQACAWLEPDRPG